MARVTSSPARGAWVHGLLTITAGRSAVVFAPTAAPRPERSTCDRTSVELFPCTRLVSVSGTAHGTVVDALRLRPVTATIDGTGERRVITFSDGPRTIRAPIRLVDGYGSTSAGSDRTSGSCSSSAASCRSSRFIEAVLRSTVTCRVHFSSILVTSRDQTLQLEAR